MRHETNSNSLTIQGTENGYLSKTILKGKTLNNIWGAKGFQINGDNVTIFQDGRIKHTSKANRYSNAFDTNLDMLKTDTDYTIIAFVYVNEFTNGRIHINNPSGETQGAFTTPIIIQPGETGIFINKISTRTSFDGLLENVGLRSFFDNDAGEVGKKVELQILVLEGDHTQNPPLEYFGGVKSVGDGVENIEISSIKSGGNLFDGVLESGTLSSDGKPTSHDTNMRTPKFIKVNPNTRMSMLWDTTAESPTNIHGMAIYYNNGKEVIGTRYDKQLLSDFTTPSDCEYIKFRIPKEHYNVYLGSYTTKYTPYKQDKKLLLYKHRNVNLFDITQINNSDSASVKVTRLNNEITIQGKLEATAEVTVIFKGNAGVYLEKGKTYTFNFESDAPMENATGTDTVEMYWYLADSAETYINVSSKNFKAVCPTTGYYYPRFDVNKGDSTHKFWNISVYEGVNITGYIPYYKDANGAWKKPVIRGFDENNCDVIKELEDGRVRYIKKYGEITIDGSEPGWSSDSTRWNETTVKPLIGNAIPNAEVNGNNIHIVCDSYKPANIYDPSITVEGIYYSKSLNIHIRILRSELGTQDLAGIKKRFKDKPMTLIYKLAQEEVYECTPIAVASFEAETTWSIESGAVSPSTSLEKDYTLSGTVSRVKDIKTFNQAMLDNNQSLVKTGVIQINNLLNKINS